MLVGLYGAGGCGRGLMPVLREQLGTHPAEFVFIDDDAADDAAVNGHRSLTWSGFLRDKAEAKTVAIAVADPHNRAILTDKIKREKVEIVGIRARNIVIMDDVEIGEGECLSPFVTLTSNIRIGRFFHANLYSYVEHDCVIGDFVTFAPGVRCNGNVRIGDFSYVGAGAVIRQGLSIGTGAIVGMGAVVTKDVPDGVTVVGNPARILEK